MQKNKVKNKKGVTVENLHISKKLIPCKRMPLFSIGKFKDLKKKASMTVEAAIVLPLFLFAMVNLTYIIDMYKTQSINNAMLYEDAKVEACIPGITDNVIKFKIYEEKPPIGLMGFKSFWMLNKVELRRWTGYDNTKTDPDEIYVFVTPNGTVYHTFQNCTNLRLSLRSVDKEEVKNLRNENREKYTACSKCKKKDDTNVVFITKWGNKYHTSMECSSIKRTVEQVKLSEVGSKPECSKCAGEDE